jgi:hypothetical protein
MDPLCVFGIWLSEVEHSVPATHGMTLLAMSEGESSFLDVYSVENNENNGIVH